MKKIAIMCAMMFSFGCASQTQTPVQAPVSKPVGMTYDISGPNKTYTHVKAYYLCGGKFTVVAPRKEVKDNDYHISITCDEP